MCNTWWYEERFHVETNLILGDCLEKLPKIPDGSISAIICDLPYNTLSRSSEGGKWDKAIPLDPLWNQFLRVAKHNAAIVLFAQGMFSAQLMMSQPKLWRYNLVWSKTDRPSGFLNARKMPLRSHEDILVFYRSLPTYNPQMVRCEPHQRNHSRGKTEKLTNRCYGNFSKAPDLITDEKYPRSILEFRRPHPPEHPTQKPVDLCRWLIRTYTNPGETVLDATCGSGTTGVAAALEGRGFYGIEKEPKYFEIAKRRIQEASAYGVCVEAPSDSPAPIKSAKPAAPMLVQGELFQ